jgi:hypothetical protein
LHNRQPEKKSAESLAFEHYCRTGERLTTAQFIRMCEKKFNPNHDELGRFTFGSGLGGGTVLNSNSNKPTPSGSGETWTDKLRSIFESEPIGRPAGPNVPVYTVKIGPISEIPGFPQNDKTSWRSSNDHVFAAAADFYNKKYKLKQGDQGFRTPEFMKSWAMVESGGEGS